MNGNLTIFKALRLHPAPKILQPSALTTNSSRPFLVEIPIELGLKIKLELRHQIERKSNDFKALRLHPAPKRLQLSALIANSPPIHHALFWSKFPSNLVEKSNPNFDTRLSGNLTIFKALRLHPPPKRVQPSALTSNSPRPSLV